MQLLTFFAAGATWALPLEVVHEIVAGIEVERLPLLPEAIPGVLSLRGVAVPVVDLVRLAGSDRADAASAAVIATGSSGLMALLVDDVGDVADADVSPSDEGAFAWTSGHAGDAIIIDIARILEDHS